MCSVKELFASPKPMKRNFIKENAMQFRALGKYCQSKKGGEVQQRVPSSRHSAKHIPYTQQLGSSNTVDKWVTTVNQSELLKSTRDSKSAQTLRKITNPTCKKSTSTKATSQIQNARRAQTAVGGKQRCNDELLKANDIAKYNQTQRANDFDHQHFETDYKGLSGSLLSLDLSSLDSVKFIKSPNLVTHRTTASQTIDPDNLDNLYSEGTIRFPTARKQLAPNLKMANKKPNIHACTNNQENEDKASILATKKTSKDAQSLFDHSTVKRDQNQVEQVVVDKSDKSNEDITDFIRLNAKAVSSKSLSAVKPLAAPPTHRKGEIPMYLQKRKEEWQKESDQKLLDAPDPACPPGHLPLADAERKETLKMLRKSYGDLVHELNMMPVRTDTLRMRQRKMDLEKQLNKLEDGIKVFSRPKVFVKIGE